MGIIGGCAAFLVVFILAVYPNINKNPISKDKHTTQNPAAMQADNDNPEIISATDVPETHDISSDITDGSDTSNDFIEQGSQEVNTSEVSSSDSKEQAISGEKIVYSIGDTWTVDGQWSLTINSITETDYRNEFSEKEPVQVFIIDFVYENIGYEDKSGLMDGLFFDLTNGQIIDSEGFMGYSYPGEVTYYATETPVGAKCKAQDCIAVDNKSSEIAINLSKYDGSGKEQKASFVLSAN